MSNYCEITFGEFKRAAIEYVGKDFYKIPTDELANKYCEAFDNDDDDAKNGYISAIICKYKKLAVEAAWLNPVMNWDLSETLDGLIDAINEACKNRVWQKKEDCNFEQVLNRIYHTRFVANSYKASNAQRVQGRAFEMSLNIKVSDGEGDRDVSFVDTIEDVNATLSCNTSHSLIQSLIDEGRPVSALIMDTFFEYKSIKTEKKRVNGTVQCKTDGWDYQLVKDINKLGKKDEERFKNSYNISDDIMYASFKDLKSATNTKKYKMIRATRDYLKDKLK